LRTLYGRVTAELQESEIVRCQDVCLHDTSVADVDAMTTTQALKQNVDIIDHEETELQSSAARARTLSKEAADAQFELERAEAQQVRVRSQYETQRQELTEQLLQAQAVCRSSEQVCVSSQRCTLTVVVMTTFGVLGVGKADVGA